MLGARGWAQELYGKNVISRPSKLVTRKKKSRRYAHPYFVFAFREIRCVWFASPIVCGLLPLLCDVLNASCLFVLKLAKGIVSVLLSLAGLPLYVVIGLFSCVVIGLFSCVVIDCLSPFCDWLPFPVL